MGYIQDSLGANERVHYVAHFHWIRYVFGYGVIVVAIALAALAYNSANPLLAVAPLVIGIVVFISMMLPIWTTEIGVTDQRIIYKRGFITRETDEMQLRSIEEVSLDQTVLGRILGYGKIQIHGTGNEEIYLPAIGDPLGMRRALQEALGSAQLGAKPVEGRPVCQGV